MEWDAVVRVDVAKVAAPLPFRVPLPRVVEPSLKVTLPVGVPDPPPVGLTVAVNATDCPFTDGLGEEVKAVEVADLLTT